MDLVEGDLEEAEAFVADRLMLNEAQLTQEAELIDAVMRNERAAYSAAGSRGRRVPVRDFLLLTFVPLCRGVCLDLALPLGAV